MFELFGEDEGNKSGKLKNKKNRKSKTQNEIPDYGYYDADTKSKQGVITNEINQPESTNIFDEVIIIVIVACSILVYIVVTLFKLYSIFIIYII